MTPSSETKPSQPSGFRLWSRRVGWLALIWVASVLALGAVAFGLRLIMKWVGLTL